MQAKKPRPVITIVSARPMSEITGSSSATISQTGFSSNNDNQQNTMNSNKQNTYSKSLESPKNDSQGNQRMEGNINAHHLMKINYDNNTLPAGDEGNRSISGVMVRNVPKQMPTIIKPLRMSMGPSANKPTTVEKNEDVSHSASSSEGLSVQNSVKPAVAQKPKITQKPVVKPKPLVANKPTSVAVGEVDHSKKEEHISTPDNMQDGKPFNHEAVKMRPTIIRSTSMHIRSSQLNSMSNSVSDNFNEIKPNGNKASQNFKHTIFTSDSSLIKRDEVSNKKFSETSQVNSKGDEFLLEKSSGEIFHNAGSTSFLNSRSLNSMNRCQSVGNVYDVTKPQKPAVKPRLSIIGNVSPTTAPSQIASSWTPSHYSSSNSISDMQSDTLNHSPYRSQSDAPFKYVDNESLKLLQRPLKKSSTNSAYVPLGSPDGNHNIDKLNLFNDEDQSKSSTLPKKHLNLIQPLKSTEAIVPVKSADLVLHEKNTEVKLAAKKPPPPRPPNPLSQSNSLSTSNSRTNVSLHDDSKLDNSNFVDTNFDDVKHDTSLTVKKRESIGKPWSYTASEMKLPSKLQRTPPARPKLPQRPQKGHSLYHYNASGPRGIAIHDFCSDQPGDLNFTKGDLICFIRQVNKEWMHGCDLNQREGMFPISFVNVIEPLPTIQEIQQKETELVSERNLTEEVICSDTRKIDEINKGLEVDIKTASLQTMHCVARFDYSAVEAGDLSFTAGDRIQLIEIVNDEWLRGCKNGLVGIFPLDYVEILHENEEDFSVTEAGTANISISGASESRAIPVNSTSVSRSSINNHSNELGHVKHDSGVLSGEVMLNFNMEELPYGEVIFNFNTGVAGDLPLLSGQIVQLLEILDENWYRGRIDDKEGIFPANYVRVIKPFS